MKTFEHRQWRSQSSALVPAQLTTDSGICREVIGDRPRPAGHRSGRGKDPIVKDAAKSAFGFLTRFVLDENGAVIPSPPKIAGLT
jgi:hypothetical protein